MSLAVIVILLAVASAMVVLWMERRKKQELELHSITPEALRDLLGPNQDVLVLDVRQPLDLLADSEIIPGATRIPPKEIQQNPSVIPKDRDAVVYCTCPGDETSRRILHQALALHFTRVKFLEGGLAAWKAKGYPVVPYKDSFHLDTRT